MSQKKLRYVAPTHVGSRAEARFPVAATPIPRRVHKSGVVRERTPDRLEVAVGVPDEVAEQLGIQGLRMFGGPKSLSELAARSA